MHNTREVQFSNDCGVKGVSWTNLGLALLVASRCLLEATSAPAAVRLDGFVPDVGTAQDVVVDSATNLAYVASLEFGLAVVDVSNPSQPVAIGGANPSFSGFYVAVSDSLAVVGCASSGMKVVDVSQPRAPRTVGSMSGTISGVAREGQYAYVLIDGPPGNPTPQDLAVVDLSTPATPTIIGRLASPNYLIAGTGIKVAGGLAYVTTGGTGSDGMQIVDVSAPATPRIINTVATGDKANGVAIANGYAYVAAKSSVQVMSLSTPSAPVRVGSLSMTNASAVAVVDTRLFVIDSADLKIVDVSTPSRPTLLGSIDAHSALTVAALGNMVFLASNVVDPALHEGGLYVVDTTDPANPTLLTNVYDGFSSAGVAVSGELAVSSGSYGMKVLDVSVPTAPRATGALGGNIGGVAMAGQYAYALLGLSGNPATIHLLVVDLSNPADPKVVNDPAHNGLLVAGDSGIAVADGFVFVACPGTGLQIVDVSVPDSPHIVQTLAALLAAQEVALANGYAYVAALNSVQVVDVHDPPNASIAGSFSPMTSAKHIAVAGNQLYVIDRQGLNILDVSDPLNPKLSSTSAAYGAQALAASGSLAFLSVPGSGHSDPNGGLYVVDAVDPTAPHLQNQIIVPGQTWAVAATESFVCAGDSAAVVDIGITGIVPTPQATRTPTATRSATPTPILTNSPTRTPTSTPTDTPTPYCGNGVVQFGEQCDLGAANCLPGQYCASGCTSACKVIGSCTGSQAACTTAADCPVGQGCCGNGTVDPGEQCDDGNLQTGDCCSNTCHVEALPCVPLPDLCAGTFGPRLIANPTIKQTLLSKSLTSPGRLDSWKAQEQFTVPAGQMIDPDTQVVGYTLSQNTGANQSTNLYAPTLDPAACPNGRCFVPTTNFQGLDTRWSFSLKRTAPDIVGGPGWRAGKFSRTAKLPNQIKVQLSGSKAVIGTPQVLNNIRRVRQSIKIGDVCITRSLDCTPNNARTRFTCKDAHCGNGIKDHGEQCGEPGLPACAAGKVCDTCVCVTP